MKLGSTIALAMAVLSAHAPASADDDHRRPASVQRSISGEQAIRIARGYGMVHVTEIERDDGGWEIEGRDHRGRKLEVGINRHGRVTKVERGDDDG